MNAPCITVATLGAPPNQHKVNAILSGNPGNYADSPRERRQHHVTDTVWQTATTLQASGRTTSLGFASGTPILQATLQADAASRWNFARNPVGRKSNAAWHSAGELLEVRQGVTPGNALDIFLLDQSAAEHLQLEEELVHHAIKSRDLGRWSLEGHGRVILYPYIVAGKKPMPAFRVNPKDIPDKTLAERIVQLGLRDALDFDIQIDDWEKQIVRQRGINKEAVTKIPTHRIASGLIRYPKTTQYLCEHYGKLEGRVFKHKNIRKFNREWYEMIWPRNPTIMLAKHRILSPSLVRSARFVLDSGGHLSDHAGLFLQPTKKTQVGWKTLSFEMQACLGQKATRRQLLLYCLAFLNSNRGSSALLEGRRPTPKGSYQVSEQSLREIFVAPPRAKQAARVRELLTLTDTLVKAQGTFSADERERLEPKLNQLVDALLDAT